MNNDKDKMRKEYNFSGGVRGKYARKYAQGTNLIALDPDVAKVYKDAKTVNELLRALMKISPVKS